MNEINRYGLSRHIPAGVEREIRQRSKFACVMCRSGFYTYEHIDPQFKDATSHDATNICCLCAACHDAVSRGQISKAAVKEAYTRVQASTPDEIARPVGPLDFHDGNAHLVMGGLLYRPAVRTILRYHGTDLIHVSPATTAGQVGSISAVFTDDSGHPVLWLEDSHWIGSLSAWDIDVTGPRITVRKKLGHVSLQLRLDPPGRIVVERLDMRYGSAHVLASETVYAAGRHISEERVQWFYANVRINSSDTQGAAIEFATPHRLEWRARHAPGSNLATKDGNLVIGSGAGIMMKSAGICIASGCSGFQTASWVIAPRSVAEMRHAIFGGATCEELCRFMAGLSTNEVLAGIGDRVALSSLEFGKKDNPRDLGGPISDWSSVVGGLRLSAQGRQNDADHEETGSNWFIRFKF